MIWLRLCRAVFFRGYCFSSSSHRAHFLAVCSAMVSRKISDRRFTAESAFVLHKVNTTFGNLGSPEALGFKTARLLGRPTVVRKVLMQQDVPNGAQLAVVSVEIPVGGREGRHTHSGPLIVYVQEGALTLDYEGKPTVTYKVGETFFVESGKIHEGINNGTVPIKALASFVTPKGAPLTTQAQ